jgi:L-amino acid N-acyltransferase YncA
MDAAMQSASVAIRDSQPADISAITALYARYVTTSFATFDEVPPAPGEMAQRREDLLGAGLPFIVATADSKLVGYAYAAKFRLRSAYRFTLEDSIYVDPSAIRRGIGSALLGALIERCTALGHRQLVAVIGDTANAGSIGMHTKMGFVRVGVMPAVGFKLGRWVDAVLMQRSLGPGASAAPVG